MLRALFAAAFGTLLVIASAQAANLDISNTQGLTLAKGKNPDATGAIPICAVLQAGGQCVTLMRADRSSGALSAAAKTMPGGTYVIPPGSDPTGVADSTAALAAWATVNAGKVVALAPGTYRIASTTTIASAISFAPGARLAPDSGVTLTLSGKIVAPDDVRIFAGSGSVVLTGATWVSVAWWGALAGGDAAPAIRAAFGSGRTIYFPPVAYTLMSTQASIYPAQDPVAVLVSGFTNFHAQAAGASFIVDPLIAFSEAIMVERSSYWTWDGGAIQGSRAALSPTDENAGFGLLNNYQFRISDMRFTGFGGRGTAFVGDFNVAGRIDKIQMDGVGICFDMAFWKNVTFDSIRAVGADANGLSGSGQVGQKCFSNVYDVPLLGYNYTGATINDTDGVVGTNLDISNFQTPVLLASGQHYRFSGNYIHDNPGLGSAKGLGYFITYYNGGVASSVGHPVKDVTITGDQIANNGSAVGGYGVLIDPSAISNGDVIDGVSINGTTFNNNATVGVGATATGNVKNVVIGPSNTFKGSAQSTGIDGNVMGLAFPTFTNNAAAVAAGLAVGTIYRLSAGGVDVVH